MLDLRELARQHPAEANVVWWVARLELDPSPENVGRVVREVLAAYPAPEHVRLRDAFREFVLGAAESWGLQGDTLERVESLKEAEMIYAGIEELKEQYRAEAERARTEGRAEGGSSVVRRQTRLKFGASTGRRTVQAGGGDPRTGAHHPDRRPDH